MIFARHALKEETRSLRPPRAEVEQMLAAFEAFKEADTGHCDLRIRGLVT